MVIEIQEKLNDEAISHKCYDKLSNDNSTQINVNKDEFTLNPTNPRCDADQVRSFFLNINI